MVTLNQLPDRLMIAAGTYDGVLAGWDTVKHTPKEESEEKESKSQDLLQMLNPTKDDENAYLKMNFAMAVHDGSVRCLSVASAIPHQKQDAAVEPGTLLSAGYDESLAMFSLTKHTQVGELKTPSNLGTPSCSSFAPPNDSSPSHVLVGLSTGKIVIYKRKDMSVQHILPGHDEKGVNCIAVHPSGKMALSGGRDGKICLWDLMRGRLAFVNKIPNPSKGRKATVNHIVWSNDGQRYAYCTHEGNIQAREMASGKTLLDIQMHPGGRANQICFIGGDDGIFLAAGCNDGGLPVFAVGSVDEEDEEAGTRRAIMAIEPVEGVATAGDERFKCIQSVNGGSGFLVVTANSGGIISVIDLEGAAHMMMSDDDGDENEDGEENSDKDDSDEDDSDSEEEEVAAEILESVRIGSGARITCISVWSYSADPEEAMDDEEMEETPEEEVVEEEDEEDEQEEVFTKKRKRREEEVKPAGNELELDEEALAKARALVAKAKKRQKKKKKKAAKKDNN